VATADLFVNVRLFVTHLLRAFDEVYSETEENLEVKWVQGWDRNWLPPCISMTVAKQTVTRRVTVNPGLLLLALIGIGLMMLPFVAENVANGSGTRSASSRSPGSGLDKQAR